MARQLRATIAKCAFTTGSRKRPKSSYLPFEAVMPNQCWLADFTHYPLEGQRGAYPSLPPEYLTHGRVSPGFATVPRVEAVGHPPDTPDPRCHKEPHHPPDGPGRR